jgi:heptose I phosphotransferase
MPLRTQVNRTSTGPDDLHQVPVDSAPDEAWVPLPGLGNGFVRRDWQTRFAAVGLTRLEDFFHAQGEPLSKPGLGRRYRARLTLPDGAQIHVAYLKRYDGESLRNLCRRWFEDGHRAPVAEREVRVPRLLAQTGVPTVQPIAWGWTGPWGRRQQSFVVTAAVPGISLERWVSGTVRQPTRQNWELRSTVVKELALLARQLHRANWRHRDLYLCHVFIEERASGFALALLDLGRVFQPRFRPARWLVKDLAQLHYSAPDHVSRAMRLRFIHHYLECNKLTPAQRQFVRQIQLKRDRIARHDFRKHQAQP